MKVNITTRIRETFTVRYIGPLLDNFIKICKKTKNIHPLVPNTIKIKKSFISGRRSLI